MSFIQFAHRLKTFEDAINLRQEEGWMMGGTVGGRIKFSFVHVRFINVSLHFYNSSLSLTIAIQSTICQSFFEDKNYILPSATVIQRRRPRKPSLYSSTDQNFILHG